MKCYDYYLGNDVITPADDESVYRFVKYLSDNSEFYRPIKLKPYTLGRKFRLIPAILAAKLARLVRKTRNKKGTILETSLMKFYYEEEVRVRGYV